MESFVSANPLGLREVRLGKPHGAEALRRAGKGGAPLRAAIARNASEFGR